MTISNLMTNPNTKNGITKDSTLVINVPPYLPSNYTQILNHVGFWKWNPTLSQFDEGSQNDYNLLVQPLWFDAESGLPQKIRINSSDTKRLKLENENQDRSSEVVEYVEPSQNNLMVRFNTKTRSITEYPYFEVEGIPPTITNPVTSNGYYKFDGNTLINGTNQDYNLNVQVSSTPITPVITINDISIQNLDTSYVKKIAVNGRYSIMDQTYSYLFLTLYNSYYYLHLYYKISMTDPESVITNDSGNIMRVFRISNASSPKNILFRYYNGSNYTNILNIRTPVNGISYSSNVNQLVTNISFNQSNYDLSSFF